MSTTSYPAERNVTNYSNLACHKQDSVRVVRDISFSWIRGCGHDYISSYKPLFRGADARVMFYESSFIIYSSFY